MIHKICLRGGAGYRTADLQHERRASSVPTTPPTLRRGWQLISGCLSEVARRPHETRIGVPERMQVRVTSRERHVTSFKLRPPC